MREVEVKILEVNKEELLKKLESLGAKKIFDGRVEAIYFETRDEKQTLRLRKNGGENELVLKTLNDDSEVKDAEELHVTTNSFQYTKKILEKLGFKPKKTRINKHRESYKLNSVRFEIDTIDGLPTFLEIEASNKEEVLAWVEKLGFSKNDAKPWTGKQVLKHYKKL